MGSRSKVKLLQVLFKFPDAEFTGEDLAGKAGVSKPRTHQALVDLVEENLVTRRVAGRAYLYGLVSSSYAARAIGALFQADRSPLAELEKLVQKKLQREPVVSAILYGSLVRKEEAAGSDIDLYLVVREEEARKRVEELVTELNGLTSSYFGNRLSALVKTVEESRRAYRSRRGLEVELEKEGRVLSGVPLREALK